MSQNGTNLRNRRLVRCVYIYMKRYVLAVMTVALSFLMLEGCTNGPTARTAQNERNASNSNPGEDTYTRHDLDKTGQADVGEALEKNDPAIRAGGSR
jgi:hypothetical protein